MIFFLSPAAREYCVDLRMSPTMPPPAPKHSGCRVLCVTAVVDVPEVVSVLKSMNINCVYVGVSLVDAAAHLVSFGTHADASKVRKLSRR